MMELIKWASETQWHAVSEPGYTVCGLSFVFSDNKFYVLDRGTGDPTCPFCLSMLDAAQLSEQRGEWDDRLKELFADDSDAE